MDIFLLYQKSGFLKVFTGGKLSALYAVISESKHFVISGARRTGKRKSPPIIYYWK